MTERGRTRETASATETEAAGAALARALPAGAVVLVSGELGAGKTTFVRGALRALGVEGPVTSPTFTLANRYETARGLVAHLDLYRLAGLAAEDPGLLDEELGGDAFAAFVEWPEQGGLVPAADAVQVRIEHAGAERRRITVA